MLRTLVVHDGAGSYSKSPVAKNHRQLIVYQKSVDLVMELYKVSGLLPREELYALSSQIRRAAVSVPSNIAEGYARRTTKELIQALGVAEGSLAEVQAQLEVACRLGFIGNADIMTADSLIVECQRMLNAIQNALRERIRDGTARR